MNTNDLLLRWSHMTLNQIEDEIRSGKDQDSAIQLLGAQTVAELKAASFAPPVRSAPDPVVLLPGIMGSQLASIRGVTTLVWINPLVFLQGNARYLGLNDEGTLDGCPEVEMMPTGLTKIPYLKMEIALNHAAELFEFPYDWRRTVEFNADVLDACLERWAGGSDRKFSLVAHSMGGLVSRAYIARHPSNAGKRLRQVILLGTPNFGATNAVDTLINGSSIMSTVDNLNKSNNMAQVVRNLPGVYNLLPAPQECFPAGRTYPASWNLYEAEAWRVAGIQQRLLDSTRDLYQALSQSDPQTPITMIAGCNLDTLVGVALSFVQDSLPKFIPTRVKEGENSGDGTVPLWSALLPGADVHYVQEKHANLPENNGVIAAVLALIQGGQCSLPSALPKPSFMGISFDVQAEVPPEELANRIRTGTASRADLDRLQFAL